MMNILILTASVIGYLVMGYAVLYETSKQRYIDLDDFDDMAFALLVVVFWPVAVFFWTVSTSLKAVVELGNKQRK